MDTVYGYAIGAGRYQKEYRTVGKRLGRLQGMLAVVGDAVESARGGARARFDAELAALRAAVSLARRLARDSMGVYSRAVKAGTEGVADSALLSRAALGPRDHMRRLFPRASTYEKGAMFVHPDRERFMDDVMKFLAGGGLITRSAVDAAEIGIRRLADAVGADIGNAGMSRLAQGARLGDKEMRRFRHGQEGERRGRRKAAHLERRAARRTAAAAATAIQAAWRGKKARNAYAVAQEAHYRPGGRGFQNAKGRFEARLA